MKVKTLHDLASLVKGRRLDLHLSQVTLGTRAGVSRKWVYEFEAGNPGAEIGNVMAVMAVLGIDLDAELRSDPNGEVVSDLDELLDEYQRE